VRTLGMHRVYNSAFMNMLKDEDNAKYRTTIKNVLEFDPQILKRFVNFMNNPDEETAVAQFGKDDKYFGVCIMMVTMPGLPMFGHGQVEGFAEKYGMEYRRAYWDEQPDQHLIARHEREVFPLMHRRHLFAGVEDFLLYDFYAPDGYVNEDVFAYSNRAGHERALVVYHNKYAMAQGWIRTSAAYSVKVEDDGDRALVQRTLGEGLGLHNDNDHFCLFRDHISGLEFIRSSQELHDRGLYVEVGAYKYHVFLEFREVQDNVWHHYAQLAAYLNGRGVPSIEEALRETFLQPVLQAFRQVANADLFRQLIAARLAKRRARLDRALLEQIQPRLRAMLLEIARFAGVGTDQDDLARDMQDELEAILRLPARFGKAPWFTLAPRRRRAAQLTADLDGDPLRWGAVLGWWAVHALGKVVDRAGFEGQSRSWIDEWLLGKVLAGVFQDLGLDEAAAWRSVALVKLLTSHQGWAAKAVGVQAHELVRTLLSDGEVQRFLQVNRYQDVLWFNKEAFEELLRGLLWVGLIRASTHLSAAEAAREGDACYELLETLRQAAEDSGYRVEELLKWASGETGEPSSAPDPDPGSPART